MAATVRKLIVEVVDARNLLPTDGQGSCSPFVQVDFYGRRRRTTTQAKSLNPTWNAVLEFEMGKPSDVFGDMVEVNVFHDKNFGNIKKHHMFLGRIRLNSTQFVKKGEEALIYYPLEKKSLLSWVRGDIGLKIYYLDEVEEPKPEPPPLPPPAEAAAAESDQPKPPAAPEESPSPAPAPQPDDVKPNEDPTAEAAANVEPGAAAEAEKPLESEPKEESKDQVEPPPAEVQPEPVQVQPDHVEMEMKAASVSKSVPEVMMFRGINGPQPIKRPVGDGSYTLDPTESMTIERSTFDLVEKMHYLFVQVVKARSLPTNGNPVVRIEVPGHGIIRSKLARKTTLFEWDQTFAFGRDSPDSSSSTLQVSVWDPTSSSENFLGGVCFDITDIPLRDPPDSPLAPQWYRLEEGGPHNGDLMLATWIGTQADDAFPDAWKTDTAGYAGNVNSRAKVYQSPKLWYLKATIIEAQDILPLTAIKEAAFQVKAQLGFQVAKTKLSVTRNGAPSWKDEDLVFVAAEPFSDNLIITLENRQSKAPVRMGVAVIPLTAIERRVDDRQVVAQWFALEADPNEVKRVHQYRNGRILLRLFFDGGYHVMDEAAHVCSDYRPTARQLWKPPVGTVELGIIGCRNLLPMKTVNGKGSTDSYCVAKYGSKWIRTRTVCDSLEPRWNEQYTWKVYDPCTVLTIGVFDSWGVFETDGSNEATRPDFRIGKVRVRISTLQTGKPYRSTYPLLVLSPAGMKKMGEVEVAIRFKRAASTLDMLHVYSQPSLPLMHHIKPLWVGQQEMLRNTAVKIVSAHLSRSEPPLTREVVLYMLDADSQVFSMRKVRANWSRIINVISGLIDIVKWVENTRAWRNPTATMLVHALVVMLVWFPDLIIPTFAFYLFAIGAWNYRFSSRDPLPHFDPRISFAESIDRDELDEEFDAVPSNRPSETVRARYEKLRAIGTRVQTVLGDFATQGERVQALVTWRDPRATGIFIGLCFVVAMILYVVPSKMVAMAFGFYYLRHPIFRDRVPSPGLNFFRRLPSLSDRIM